MPYIEGLALALYVHDITLKQKERDAAVQNEK
jgi:hypothetical protein